MVGSAMLGFAYLDVILSHRSHEQLYVRRQRQPCIDAHETPGSPR